MQHDKKITANGSKLHLNRRGTEIPSNTFIESISNIVHWQSILHSPDNCLIDECNVNLSSKEKLSIIRKRSIGTNTVAHLKINSLRNKFDSLISQMTGSIDILMMSETKLDDSFPIAQFIMEGFRVPYRVKRNGNGGGIMLFVREDIPTKLLSVENSPTEAFFIEINLRKKTLFSCSYNPNRENIENRIESLSKNLALYSSRYEKLIITSYLNVCVEEISISEFCDTFGLKTLMKDATCYKNPEIQTALTSL